ncbi:hypothetical protein Asi03nite_43970 [Actinoplanes siamensis]|uniref:Uncharacterized protein n=2 Tax=Actinoplanes siamensis TaxID=1223317 RepID=A0A919N980_9ACTN|nr:hypothetical protein Asi03nite_43970 [Actinoplanes siamensis]
MPKDWKRRAELRRTAKRLRRLSLRPVPAMAGEDRLRQRVRRQLAGTARYGIDDSVVSAVHEVIESHVVEMEVEILRRHTAEEVELGKAQAQIDGLVTQYDHDEESRGGRIQELKYVKRGARRGVEQRDTPMPAGPDGIEEAGYQTGNVGELAGRGLVTMVVLYVVLALAMVADLITFRQVVERMLNDATVFPLVVALTVTTTYVAHLAGECLRRARETRRRIRRAVLGWGLAGVWLAMGLGAFVFRLLAPAPPSGDAASAWANAGPAPADDGQALGAVLMLLLYGLTGAIALTAGYHRPRAEVAQYTRTSRRLRRAEPRHGALLRDAAEARALRAQLDELRDSRKRQYAVEIDRCRSAARRIRAEAAILIRQLRLEPEQSWLRRRLSGPRPAPAQSEPEPGPPQARED